MIRANCSNNGVWTLLYPIADVIGGQNSRFKKSSSRLAWNLIPFAANLRLGFLRALAWRSGRPRFEWGLRSFSGDDWLGFLRVLTWQSSRRPEMRELFPAS